MNEAVDVAYRMLQLARAQGISLSNLQLQKLVYIAHGYQLGWKGQPLYKETTQAWKYGPVIRSVYRQFKRYGANEVPTKHIDEVNVELLEGDGVDEVLDGVLGLYGKDSGSDLINLTHQEETPWDEVWNKNGGKDELFAEIPDTLIRHHFQKVVLDPSSVNGL